MADITVADKITGDTLAAAEFQQILVAARTIEANTAKVGVTPEQTTLLGNTSGTNTGDDAGVTAVTGTSPVASSGGATPVISIPAATNLAPGHVTAAQITALEANNAKETNATHTGEVTGSTALTVDKTTITGKAAVTAEGADYILLSDTSDAGTLKKALASDLVGSAGSVEGSAVLSTGEAGGSKFLREGGDGARSWQAISGGGDALTSSPLSQFAATTSAQLAAGKSCRICRRK